jgi:integrase
MATATYYLNDPKATEKTLIFLRLRLQDTNKKKINLTFSTSKYIHPNDWIQKANRPRKDKHNSDLSYLDSYLKDRHRAVMRLVDELLMQSGTIYLPEIKSAVAALFKLKTDKQQKKITFTDYVDDYIKHRCIKKLWTKKHYVTTLRALKRYEEDKKIKLYFEDITLKEFYYPFIKWCYEVPYKTDKRGREIYYALNTIGTFIKEVKAFMNQALDEEVSQCMGHLHKKFIVMDESSDSIALNVDELNKIYNYHFSNPTLEKVRDLFILNAWTGVRYETLHQITPDKFIDNGTLLHIGKTDKTGSPVTIPLHDHARAIIEKYNGHIPPVYSNQPYNRYLKIIARLVGLTNKFSKTITRRNKKITTNYFYWELVTVHTARRSFATNLYNAGIDLERIRFCTGHESEKQLRKYIKSSICTVNARIIKDNDVFKAIPYNPLRIAK